MAASPRVVRKADHRAPVPKVQRRHEAEFERMSDDEIIKAIEERANKLGIKIKLSYDFGSGRLDDAQ